MNVCPVQFWAFLSLRGTPTQEERPHCDGRKACVPSARFPSTAGSKTEGACHACSFSVSVKCSQGPASPLLSAALSMVRISSGRAASQQPQPVGGAQSARTEGVSGC